MFEATIHDTKSWKNSVDAIAALIDEGTFQITQTGLKLRAMDPSQIALVDFELPAKAFEKFKCDTPINIGIDFAELNKITKRLRPEDKIDLKVESTRLKLVFRGDARREFSLAIIESSSTPPKEPNIEFTSEVKIAPSLIKEALKDAELVSSHVAFRMEGKGFSIKSDGDTGSVDISFPEDKLLSINVKNESRAVFSLDHLNNILRAADVPSVVAIRLRTDAPLKVEYAVGDGRVVYYLAPRIESI
ncbi:MAG: proliferating cell nuclear antigen (pcna) [Candidatus Altiarchaeota archaeon]|nr:proliferating cell nuclear antigen (pcna) [Candidatus Altiarchaeota archaeon]